MPEWNLRKTGTLIIISIPAAVRPSLQCVEACSQEDWEPGTYAAMGPPPIANQDLLVGVGGLGVPEFCLWQVPDKYLFWII